MAKTISEKVADQLIDGVSSLNWNVQLFIGHLLEQPPRVQRAVIMTMLIYLRQYKANADNPHLSWRICADTAHMIYPEDLEAVNLEEDLTDYPY